MLHSLNKKYRRLNPTLQLWTYKTLLSCLKNNFQDFPGGPVVKNPPANAGDMNSIPGLGKSHMPQLLRHTCLEPVLNKRNHMRSLCTMTKNSNQRKPVCSNEDPVWPKRKLSWHHFPSGIVLHFSSALQQVPQMLFILNVSHSYLPAFSWTHTPPWPVMITWHLFLSRSAWPSCCYTQWLLLSPHRTPSLSSCDPCPGFPGHHTLHVLFLSLPPVHSVSCAGSGLPSFLKMLQCPGALFPATSVSY